MRPLSEQIKWVQEQWNIGELKYLQFSESFVFEGEVAGKPVIARFVLPNHREMEDVESELDWIQYLSEKGLSVASPVASRENRLVEAVPGAPKFFANVFTRAPGQAVTPSDLSLTLFRTWGRYLGKMHRWTKSYTPSKGIKPRAQWNEDEGFKCMLRGLDENDAIPFDCFHEFYSWVQSLEKDTNCFGLVHSDLHLKNFFINDGKITSFDFDDSCYHWFSHDLAVPLHSVLHNFKGSKLSFSYEEALDNYYMGYSEENEIEQKWIDRVDLFLKFRIASVYHWIKGRMLEGTITQSRQVRCDQILHWNKSYLEKD